MSLFKEVTTPVDSESSFYDQYPGNSIGRILHYLQVYCGVTVAESVCVGDGEIKQHGETIALYSWDNGYPYFVFVNKHYQQHQDEYLKEIL